MIDLKQIQPKELFLFDGVGALVSAFLLGVVLVSFQSFIGIPIAVLRFLAILPIGFALYDAYCYYKVVDNYSVYLRGIATINLIYCCISIALACVHIEQITIWGWLYIGLESLIVVALAIVEFKVASK